MLEAPQSPCGADSAKEGEQLAQMISWIRAKTSFAILRSALVCLKWQMILT